MHRILTLIIIAVVTWAAWRDRAPIATTLEDEWTAFLDELEVIA